MIYKIHLANSKIVKSNVVVCISSTTFDTSHFTLIVGFSSQFSNIQAIVIKFQSWLIMKIFLINFDYYRFLYSDKYSLIFSLIFFCSLIVSIEFAPPASLFFIYLFLHSPLLLYISLRRYLFSVCSTFQLSALPVNCCNN